MLRALVLFSLVGLSSPCFAVTVQLATFPPNPGVLPGGGWRFTTGTTFANPPGPRAWVNGVYGGVPRAVATDTLVLAGRAGPLAVQAVSSVLLTDLAAAAGRCILLANPYCAAGAATWLLYDNYRARNPRDVPGSMVPPGMVDYDPGQSPEVYPHTMWRCTTPTTTGYVHSSPILACSAAIAPPVLDYTAQCTSGAYISMRVTRSLEVVSQTAAAATIGLREVYERRGTVPVGDCGNQVAGSYLNPNWGYADSSTSNTAACPASVDPFDSRYSLPAGLPIGSDGLCPTARHNHVPKTPVQMVPIITAGSPSAPAPGLLFPPMPDWSDVARDVIDFGREPVPSDLSVSGPASQTGQPTTTTTTGAQGTTTTTSTPTYTYTYAGDTISYSTTVVTVNNTVNNNGTVTTTTEEVHTPGPVAGALPDPAKDPCVENPSRVGCMSLGEAPKEDKPTAKRDVVWSAEVLSLPSACPAPVSLPTGHVLTYTSACDAAVQLRPVIIALATLSALFLVVAALRAT